MGAGIREGRKFGEPSARVSRSPAVGLRRSVFMTAAAGFRALVGSGAGLHGSYYYGESGAAKGRDQVRQRRWLRAPLDSRPGWRRLTSRFSLLQQLIKAVAFFTGAVIVARNFGEGYIVDWWVRVVSEGEGGPLS